jgi:putative ABC transport system substrate-binding protein
LYVGNATKRQAIGANPAELPFQESNSFELAINLKTTKTLGLTMPAGILSIADVVIE